MCKWICRYYDCGDKTHIVSSFCQRYIKTRGRVCHARSHIHYNECHMGEVCPKCRNVMTDNHRQYIFRIYENLNKTHPDRNWEGIVAAARRPSLNKSGFIG